MADSAIAASVGGGAAGVWEAAVCTNSKATVGSARGRGGVVRCSTTRAASNTEPCASTDVTSALVLRRLLPADADRPNRAKARSVAFSPHLPSASQERLGSSDY